MFVLFTWTNLALDSQIPVQNLFKYSNSTRHLFFLSLFVLLVVLDPDIATHFFWHVNKTSSLIYLISSHKKGSMTAQKKELSTEVAFCIKKKIKWNKEIGVFERTKFFFLWLMLKTCNIYGAFSWQCVLYCVCFAQCLMTVVDMHTNRLWQMHVMEQINKNKYTMKYFSFLAWNLHSNPLSGCAKCEQIHIKIEMDIQN